MCDSAATVRFSRCLACDGEFIKLTEARLPGEYGRYLCRHCNQGIMDAQQVSNFLSRKSEHDELQDLDSLFPDTGTTFADVEGVDLPDLHFTAA